MGDDDVVYDFKATGVSSGEVVEEGDITQDGDLTANEMTVYESKPIVAFVALSDKVLANATKTIFKFSVATDTTGDEVLLEKIILTVTGVTDGTLVLNDVKLYRTGKTAALVEADETVDTGTVAADGTLTFDLTALEEEVSALTNYYVTAAITGADVDEDLSTRFQDADTAFTWSDGTTEGIDAALLTIPEDVATLSK